MSHSLTVLLLKTHFNPKWDLVPWSFSPLLTVEAIKSFHLRIFSFKQIIPFSLGNFSSKLEATSFIYLYKPNVYSSLLYQLSHQVLLILCLKYVFKPSLPHLSLLLCPSPSHYWLPSALSRGTLLIVPIQSYRLPTNLLSEECKSDRITSPCSTLLGGA